MGTHAIPLTDCLCAIGWPAYAAVGTVLLSFFCGLGVYEHFTDAADSDTGSVADETRLAD